MSAFNSTTLFYFFFHHIPTNSVAPFFTYIYPHTTHNSSYHFDEGLTLEMSAFKLFTLANLIYKLS